MSPVQPPLPAVPPPTRQLPAVPPPASGSTAVDPGGRPAAPSAGPVPTGPVDWMPLPPEPGALPPVPRPDPADGPAEAAADHEPATGRRRVRVRLPQAPRAPRGGRGTAAAVLGAVALLLLELGLVVHEAGTTLWGRVPLWSGFATAAAVVGLAAVASRRAPARLRDRAWGVGAGGLTGFAVFWVLVVLPTADTDRGFVLTAALACLGGCLWLTAGRGRTAGTGTPVEGNAGSEPDAGTPEAVGTAPGSEPQAEPVEEPSAGAGTTAGS